MDREDRVRDDAAVVRPATRRAQAARGFQRSWRRRVAVRTLDRRRRAGPACRRIQRCVQAVDRRRRVSVIWARCCTPTGRPRIDRHLLRWVDRRRRVAPGSARPGQIVVRPPEPDSADRQRKTRIHAGLRPMLGATLGGVDDPARAGLGITADGRLIWAAGAHLMVSELASALADAHVVRAVELDMDPEWVAGYLYGHRGGAGPLAPVPVLANQQGIPVSFSRHGAGTSSAWRPDEHPWERSSALRRRAARRLPVLIAGVGFVVALAAVALFGRGNGHTAYANRRPAHPDTVVTIGPARSAARSRRDSSGSRSSTRRSPGTRLRPERGQPRVRAADPQPRSGAVAGAEDRRRQHRYDLGADTGIQRPGGIGYGLSPRWLSITHRLARDLDARLIMGVTWRRASLRSLPQRPAHSSPGSADGRCGRSRSATSPRVTTTSPGTTAAPANPSRAADELRLQRVRPRVRGSRTAAPELGTDRGAGARRPGLDDQPRALHRGRAAAGTGHVPPVSVQPLLHPAQLPRHTPACPSC